MKEGAYNSRAYPIERIVEWETALRDALKTLTPKVADRLAPRFAIIGAHIEWQRRYFDAFLSD